MVFLRVASLVILAIWVGGLAVLGLVVAPTIFASLQAQDPVGGRVLAAQVFGAVFERFQHVSWVLGVLLVASLAARALLGPRPGRLAWRLWAVAGMLALSLVTTSFIGPRIDRIRLETSGSVASLPDSDPRKAEFGRLHGLSIVFMIATLLLGTGLYWLEANEMRD